MPGEWKRPILTFPQREGTGAGRRDEGEWGEGNERLLTGGRSLVPFGI
ncbi:hypothetical protein [uncultured Prevotella sp.]|nr:hypothetical protein [uncultured Prevotella sp.]